MRLGINKLYRNAAEEFARRVISSLNGQVDSIVLYGSAARGQARRDSDIDILVVSRDPGTIKEIVSEICAEFAYERNFAFFISLIHRSSEDVDRLRQIGSPFIRDVMTDGVILYDDGTYARIRQEAVAASR